MPKVAPSLLSADFCNIYAEIAPLLEAGCDILHLDIMDGSYVPNITFGHHLLSSLRSNAVNVELDVHLMVEKPENQIDKFIEAGATSLSFHPETTRHVHRLVTNIKQSGCKAGVALNPHVPLSSISEVISELDFVLIMSVNPGFAAQKFISSSVKKIKRLAQYIHNEQLAVKICVDGGMNPDTISQVTTCGADILVAGNSIFASSDRAAAHKNLTEVAERGSISWKKQLTENTNKLCCL